MSRVLHHLNMRGPIMGLCLCLSLLMAATCAQADHAGTSGSPSDALRSGVDHVLMTLKDPGYTDPAKRPALRAKIEQEVRQIFDFGEFSKRTLGSHWASFSPAQQQRFSDAFAKLLISTYLDKVNGYNGEKVVYLGERFTQNNRLAEVQTTITLSSGQVTPVAYRMLIKDGAWRIYDVLVENVGLNSNYRAQFNEILVKSSPDELIQRVEERVKELPKAPGA